MPAGDLISDFGLRICN